MIAELRRVGHDVWSLDHSYVWAWLALLVLWTPMSAEAQETREIQADDASAVHLYLHDPRALRSPWHHVCALPCSLAFDPSDAWALGLGGDYATRAEVWLDHPGAARAHFEDRHALRDTGVVLLAVLVPIGAGALITDFALVLGGSSPDAALLALGVTGLALLVVGLAAGIPLAALRDVARIES